MILIYTSFGCASCRKVKEWLKVHNIPYAEKNIFTSLLNEDELKFLLQRTENGTDDLISKRSKIITENHIDVDSMSISELIDFIKQNPSVLRRPIILDQDKFLVGYDAEEIEMFKPRKLRDVATNACSEDCPNYPCCGELNNDTPSIGEKKD